MRAILNLLLAIFVLFSAAVHAEARTTRLHSDRTCVTELATAAEHAHEAGGVPLNPSHFFPGVLSTGPEVAVLLVPCRVTFFDTEALRPGRTPVTVHRPPISKGI